MRTAGHGRAEPPAAPRATGEAPRGWAADGLEGLEAPGVGPGGAGPVGTGKLRQGEEPRSCPRHGAPECVPAGVEWASPADTWDAEVKAARGDGSWARRPPWHPCPVGIRSSLRPSAPYVRIRSSGIQ